MTELIPLSIVLAVSINFLPSRNVFLLKYIVSPTTLALSARCTYSVVKKQKSICLIGPVIIIRRRAKKLARLKQGQALHLVFGGRFVPMKGVMALPEVAVELRKASVPFTLDIYGDGPQGPDLKNRIAALGLDDVVRVHDPLDFRSGWVPMLMEMG